MKLVDLPFFVELGGALEQASKIDARGPLYDALVHAFRLRQALGSLMVGDRAKLTACGHDLVELINLLNAFETRHFRDPEGNWITPPDSARSEYELNLILSKVEQFRTVLIADLRIMASFTVTRSGIFDVNQLVNCARNVLPTAAFIAVSEDVLKEVDDAGKCLAFNLPTACGFHAMRAVERVIKRYLADFLPAKEIQKFNNWGQYLGALERQRESDAEPKPTAEAIALLRQIKEIYRNPVIHPDRTLSSEEAATLFHSTVAAISRVAIEVAERQLAPVRSIAGVRPSGGILQMLNGSAERANSPTP
ncbi:hypothetical protein [Sphingomonas sp. URHD0057]|uniref:hypothetical protein n=1 Tax=Sphingomonas sp. URHD0057 TaxID=1380389 RepID=UPI00048B8354|nr:hypothetical protein [Sphingomonas sp. URHD0057]